VTKSLKVRALREIQNRFFSSDVTSVIHSLACFSMKSTSWTEQIPAKLIYVVSACTRVIYSPAGFRKRLLVWLTSSPVCTNSFCPNWPRLLWGA